MNYGQGYTHRDICDMSFATFQFHVGALNKKLTDEADARRAAATAARRATGRKF